MAVRILSAVVALAFFLAPSTHAALFVVSPTPASSIASTLENASTAFLEADSESRIGLLCHNDPVNKSDPMGLETLTRPEMDGEIGDRVAQAAQFIGHQVAEMYRQDPIGFVILVATMGRAPEAGGARLPAIKSEYVPRTFEGARVTNRVTDVSRSTFEKNLSNSGWSKSASKDGKVTNYEKDGAKYSVRDNAKSTGGPTADYYKAGSDKPDIKIRLKKDE